jgi:ribosome-associated toxin RatA of RatAB toxin-antitoxin module
MIAGCVWLLGHYGKYITFLCRLTSGYAGNDNPWMMANFKNNTILLTVLWIILVPAGHASLAMALEFGPSGLGPDDYRRLAAGDVLTRVEQPDSLRKGWVQAAVLIDAPVRAVWNALTDCQSATQIMPGLVGCKVIEPGQNVDIVQQRVKLSWYLPTFTYVFRVHYNRYSRIEFQRIGGSFKEMEGCWTFESYPNSSRTLAVYSVHMDPGFWIPRWLTRHLLRKDLPHVMTDLQQRMADFYQAQIAFRTGKPRSDRESDFRSRQEAR